MAAALFGSFVVRDLERARVCVCVCVSGGVSSVAMVRCHLGLTLL